jgi:hypothetical protein
MESRMSDDADEDAGGTSAAGHVARGVAIEVARSLLADANESSNLDYKHSVDLDDQRACVELAKDVAAFSAQGGYLLIGADDHGQPTGAVTERHFQLFDDATVRGKLGRYLPSSVDFEVGRHQLDGVRIVLIRVNPHSDGFVAMENDGVHGSPPKTVFLAGDVFVRHGTRSERWNQHDIGAIIRAIVRREHSRWITEELPGIVASHAVAANAETLAKGPATSLRWDLDEDVLHQAVLEQLRAGDRLGSRLLLLRFKSEAHEALQTGDRPRFNGLLDNLASVGASALLADDEETAQRVVGALKDAYELPTNQFGHPQAIEGIDPVHIWIDVIRRVYALGALAVRLENWTYVRVLATVEPVVDGLAFYHGWLRHALTMAARGGQLDERDGDVVRSLSLLVFARDDIMRVASLRPDQASEHDVLESLCQFDALAGLVLISGHPTVRDGRVFYPNFARFDGTYVRPALDRGVFDPGVRGVIAPVSDPELASALDNLNTSAHQESMRFAFGQDFLSERVHEFIREQRDSELPDGR